MKGAAFQLPPRDGNHLALLAGGPSFYPAIEQALRAARREILIGMYLWENDATGRRFLYLCRDAARRGLRVIVLLDGIGARSVDVEDLESLRAAGGSFAFYHALGLTRLDSRLFRRYHRKLLLVDGRVAFTGGAGFSELWEASPPREWWDLMVRITGPVLSDLREIFVRDWRRAAGEELPPLDGAGPGGTGEQRLHVLVTRRGKPELVPRLVQAIEAATRRVDICSAYFVPGFRVRRALRAAAGRGVAVRLLLPGHRSDHFAVWIAGRRYYQRLLTHGVRIHEWRRGTLHAKSAVVDESWGFVGSSNLDNWSGRFNLELDVGLHSPAALQVVARQFETDLAHCREITLPQWKARPLSLRLAEIVFGWIDPLL